MLLVMKQILYLFGYIPAAWILELHYTYEMHGPIRKSLEFNFFETF